MEQVTVRDLLEATGGRLLLGEESAALNHIRLDSRQAEQGDLFVPIIGEKVDAHRFLGQVAALGAGAVFTSRHHSAAECQETMEAAYGKEDAPAGKTAWIEVDDTKKALQALGSYLRNRLTLPLIGVTGSVGKTTTREMIAAALSARYQVYKTPGNSNSQVGVPITISEIKRTDEIGVIELGMSEPGELTVIARIARIDMAVITNVGVTHIEQLGSRENIYKEKMTIQDGLKDGGILILNGDDDLLCHTKGKPGTTTLYYGTGENADIRGFDIRPSEMGTDFTVSYGGVCERVHLNVMGRHNVLNALAAIAVCLQYGMTMAEAARGLLTFTGFKNRQQIYEGVCLTILDDSYNASPASMKASLEVFAGLKKGERHIAVLADMKELGENVLAYHREVGEYAAALPIDFVATVGEYSKVLAAAVRETSRGAIPTREFDDQTALTAWLDQEIKPKDVLLFKGSNSMGLSKAAAYYIEKAGVR